MMIATRHGNFAVKKGDKLAGTRIIPLVIEEEKMKAVRERTMELTGGKPILELKPFQHKQVGIVTTGNEVFHGQKGNGQHSGHDRKGSGCCHLYRRHECRSG